MGKRIIDAEPGEHIEDFAARLIVMAWVRGAEVTGRHNEHTVKARPGSVRCDVIAPWTDAMFKSYFGGDR